MKTKSKVEQIFLMFALMIPVCLVLLAGNGLIQIAQAETDDSKSQIIIPDIPRKISCIGLTCGNINSFGLNRTYLDFGGAACLASNYFTCAYGRLIDGNTSCFDCNTGCGINCGKPKDTEDIIFGWSCGHDGCKIFGCGSVIIGEPFQDNARVFFDQNYRVWYTVMDKNFQDWLNAGNTRY
jgi:hypothetical protein